jgi:hypothetical protein
MDPIHLTLPGTPRTKKTSSRVVRAGKFVRVLPSEAFVDYENRCVHELHHAIQADPRFPLEDRPWNVEAIIYRDKAHGDAVGYYQAVADILQTLDVVSNDRWIVRWNGSRLRKDAGNPRVELIITPAEDLNTLRSAVP